MICRCRIVREMRRGAASLRRYASPASVYALRAVRDGQHGARSRFGFPDSAWFWVMAQNLASLHTASTSPAPWAMGDLYRSR